MTKEPSFAQCEAVRIFGSHARGDADADSDLDVLVVLPDGRPDLIERVRCEVASFVGDGVDISLYSTSRVREMFESGHLFAWHIWLESRPIALPVREPDLIHRLGPPRRNCNDPIADIAVLVGLLKGIPKGLLDAPRNAVFEAGIAYVAARNIAISASAVLLHQPVFDRAAPYRLNADSLHLSRAMYDILAKARQSSQRGLPMPVVAVGDLLQAVATIQEWADSLQKRVMVLE